MENVYSSDRDILVNAQISGKPEDLLTDKLSRDSRARHDEQVRQGFQAVNLSWPNGIRAITYCEQGTTLPHPADVITVYKRCLENRAAETDATPVVDLIHSGRSCTGPLDTVTILLTMSGKLATKQFSKSPPKSEIVVQAYDAGYQFSILNAAINVSSIHDLSEVLTACEQQPCALIIRGEPISADLVGKTVTRTGSGDGVNFVGNFKTPDQGRFYLEVDVDKYELPNGWKLNQASIDKICEHIVHQLPPEFHDATYHWQLSSSAGVFDITKVSVHFWFWLKCPVPDAELKRWAKHVNTAAGLKLVDPALFQHVQAHYTAAPIFTGMADPFPMRSGLTRKSQDSVNLQLPAAEVNNRLGTVAPTIAHSARSGTGFEHFLNQIGDHPGGDGFHMPIIQAIASYVWRHGAEETDIEVLYSTVRERVLAADRSSHEDAYVEQMASGTHILPSIASAQRKYGDAAAQRRKSRRIEGIEPHFKDAHPEATDIQQRMRNFLKNAR